MSARVIGTLHTSLTVENLERSISFYRDQLGMEVRVRQFSDTPYIGTLTGFEGAQLDVALLAIPGDDHLLELIEYHQPKGALGAVAANAIAGHHMAFLVEGIDELAARLASTGSKLVSLPVQITHGVNRGAKGFYFRDPDGHILELHERSPR